jgi:RNA polymerase sigma-70 factor, ECF subfamily
MWSAMAPDDSFQELMQRLRGGDEAAATILFQRFARRLIGLARHQLDQRFRGKLDAEDVVQSVFKSFFPRFADGCFELDGWEGLWALLTVITLRKCGRQVEYFRALRRDVRREAALPPFREQSEAAFGAVAREPTAAEAAVLAETLEQLMHGLGERERTILELRLQGYTVPEISERVGRSEYTIHWVLKRVRKRLRAIQDRADRVED